MKRMESLKKDLLRAITVYNRFRSPEATAELVELTEDTLIVDFEGSFCATCGTYDWLEDLIYEAETYANLKLEIASFENHGPETIRVRYSIRSHNKNRN
jgi:hypothetical protein